MNRSAYLIPVEIHEGMFSSETCVVMKNSKGEEVSGFFQNEYIKEGKLEVMAGEEKNGLVLISIPGRTLEDDGSHGILTVKKSQLKYVA